MVIYTCPYVPAELITAHGLQPRRIMPHARAIAAPAGMCPYASGFIHDATHDVDAQAIIVTTVCDQMRRASEIIAKECETPVFLLHVPATSGDAAQGYYCAELRRLSEFLQRIGRRILTDEEFVAEMMLRSSSYSSAPFSIHSAFNFQPSALALVGSPMLTDTLALFEMIAVAGGRVVLDATETGELGVHALFDPERMRQDPFAELARAYLAIPHAFRRPNTALYEWLGKMLPERGVQGIVFLHYLWCDTWHAEAQRMKEWSGLPLLVLDMDHEAMRSGRIATRIQAFLEMLQ